MGGFITGSPVWASDFIRGHGKDPDFINILVNAEQIPPVCRFSPAARALRRSTFASPIRTVDNAFKIIGLHIVHSQVRDDFGIPVESKKRHGDDHRQDAQMVNIRSHARQCQLADLGSGSCESGRVERCVSLEKSGCAFSESGSRAAAVASERPRRPRSAPSNELQVPRPGLEPGTL